MVKMAVLNLGGGGGGTSSQSERYMYVGKWLIWLVCGEALPTHLPARPPARMPVVLEARLGHPVCMCVLYGHVRTGCSQPLV